MSDGIEELTLALTGALSSFKYANLPHLPVFPALPGYEQISFRDWQVQVNTRGAMCKWTTEEWNHHFLSLLKGPAKKAYEIMAAEVKADHKAVMQGLKAKFEHLGISHDPHFDFATASKLPAESLDQYYWRLEELQHRAFPTTACDEVLLQAFLRGLPQTMAVQLAAIPFTKSQDALVSARNIQRVSSQHPGPAEASVYHVENKLKELDNAILHAKQSSIEGQGDRRGNFQNGQRPNASVICGFCGKMGHPMKLCYQWQETASEMYQPRNPRFQPRYGNHAQTFNPTLNYPPPRLPNFQNSLNR